MAKDIKLTIPVLNNIAVRIAEQTLKNNITDEATIRKIAGVTVKRLMSESMEHGDDVPGDFWEFIQEFWNEIDSTEDPAEQAGYYAEWLFGKTSAVEQVVEDLHNGVSEEELEQDLAGEPDDFGIVGFAHDIMRVYRWFQECHDADVRRGVVPGDNAGEVKEEGAPVGDEFHAHGYQADSNFGGKEIEISKSGDAARFRTNYDGKVSEPTDWMEIEFDENGVAFVKTQNGTERLDQYMRY